MARSGVEYSNVAEACERLLKELGREPQVREVLQRVGGGGSRVTGFVRDWKRAREQQAAAPTRQVLPQAIVVSIEKELDRIRAEAEAALAPQIASERERADTLQGELARAEAERAELREALEAASRERDQANAIAGERQAQIERLNAVVAEQQQARAAAEKSASAAEARATELERRLEDLRASLADMRSRADRAEEQSRELQRQSTATRRPSK